MIAQRFRALGWVAGVASAATCLYLTSLQVAAERAKLDATEMQIAGARRDMRQLQTELGTRASLRQLEKWNGEVLALTAPRAEQYLHGEAELASVGMRELKGPTGAAPLAQVMLAAARTTPEVVPAAAPASPTVQRVAFVPAPAKPVADAKPKAEAERVVRTKPKPDRKPAVREAATKPRPKPAPKPAPPERVATAKPKPVKPAAKDGAVLTRSALGDIARVAKVEAKAPAKTPGPRR